MVGTNGTCSYTEYQLLYVCMYCRPREVLKVMVSIVRRYRSVQPNTNHNELYFFSKFRVVVFNPTYVNATYNVLVLCTSVP